MIQESRNCPDRTRLETCLANACDFHDATIVEHLERCPACQNTLAELAGTQQEWQVAQESLSNMHDREQLRMGGRMLALSNGGFAYGHSNSDDPLGAHEIQQLRVLLAEPSHPELLGRIGRYEIEQLVGRGGMGLVFRAHDTELHRVVAIKTLGLHLVPIAAARERFIREARACAGLSHPHVVPMYDVITDGPIPALVMQYIAGPTLDQYVREHGPLDWRQVLQLAIQLADALSAAHAQGLVHRDIKPGNVMLEADASRALLMDFGLVRILDDATLTRSGILAGTPQFMSPEQAHGESVDERSDLFALGALIYYMISGLAPFQADQPMAVLNRICHQPHQPLDQVHPNVPVELSRVVDQLLAKRAKHRFQSARQLRERLTELAIFPNRLMFRTKSTVTFRSIAIGVSCGLVLIVGGLMGDWRHWDTWPNTQPPSISVNGMNLTQFDPDAVTTPIDVGLRQSLPEVLYFSPDAISERNESSAALDHLETLLESTVDIDASVESSLEPFVIEIDNLYQDLRDFETKLKTIEDALQTK